MDYQIRINPINELNKENKSNFSVEFNLNENLGIIDNKLFLKQPATSKRKGFKK